MPTKQMLILLALMLSPVTAHALTASSAAKVPVMAAVTSIPITVSADATAGATSSAASAAITVLDSLRGATTTATTTGSTSESADASLGMPLNVATDADLANYTEQVAASHPDVVSVEASASGTVAVTYAHHAKLFGIIPVTIESQTSVSRDADGSPRVTTTFPWWHLFVTGTGSTAATVDSSIQASAVTAAYAATDSPSAKAQVAADIIATLDAEAGVDANASATTQF